MNEPIRLFVGGLNYSTTDAELKAFIEGFGYKVSDAHIIIDRDTQRSKGYGFVSIHTNNEDGAILTMNGKELAGRPLTVNRATARTPRK